MSKTKGRLHCNQLEPSQTCVAHNQYLILENILNSSTPGLYDVVHGAEDHDTDRD